MKRALLGGALGLMTLASAGLYAATDTLPKPAPSFGGTIGRTYRDSTPSFPPPLHAPKGAPNVLLVLLDDVGFGHTSTFGGPIATPALDRLASQGLRYNQFHTTSLCSPTRAALATGRNHHSVGMGSITEFATGYPAYDSIMPKSAATLAETLRENGYITAVFGKWHMTPDWETGPFGPFTHWPTGSGFDYFYGFLGGDTNQYAPALYEGTKPIDPPGTAEQGYLLTNDLANQAISWMRYHQAVAPDQPFFAYFATGAAHAPHQVSKEWIDKYSGKFDQGWDKVREETLERQKKLGVVPPETKLTPRPAEIPAWDDESAQAKKLFARMQENYAGFLSEADEQIGRVIGTVDELGVRDNTLILYIVGDNGPSAEGTLQGTMNEVAEATGVGGETVASMMARFDEIGGPDTYGHYPVGWAWAGSSPFQWTKQIASHLGGTRNPMVVSWPKRIKDMGSLRTQFHHVIDVAPTVLEAAGIPQPSSVNGVEQKPIEGVSMVYTWDQPKAPSERTTQYFEMFGNRAIYHDGWMAAARHGRLPWETVGVSTGVFDKDRWELYDLGHDFSEADDLASKRPDKLHELQGLFDQEAKKYGVYPLDDRFAERAVTDRPNPTEGRSHFTFYPGAIRLTIGTAPTLRNRSYSLSADVDLKEGQGSGVIVTDGGKFGGFAFLLDEGRPTFLYNWGSSAQYVIASTTALPVGQSTVGFDFAYDGGKPGSGGTGTLYVDGKQVAQGRIAKTMPMHFSLDETFDVGRDTGTAVGDYPIPSELVGLQKVNVELR